MTAKAHMLEDLQLHNDIHSFDRHLREVCTTLSLDRRFQVCRSNLSQVLLYMVKAITAQSEVLIVLVLGMDLPRSLDKDLWKEKREKKG